MPQSGYEFRATADLMRWTLARPGRRPIAGGSIGWGQTPADAMRRARHVLGYTACRRVKVIRFPFSWAWEISCAKFYANCAAGYGSRGAARRGLARARAAARGARIVTG